ILVDVLEVKQIAKEYHIEFNPAYIFFLRCGFTKTWDGLIQSEEVTRFLWDNHIVAVAGDGVSFEVMPNKDHDWSLHNICLAGWGVPIGEMFDLERLAELCKKLDRWSFFVTSSPLDHPRAVSSPLNCMVLF
ncbi:hypothetical protein P171DRAFT_348151, partial [Karstenula rhodostoma CBS 690.94]